MERNWKKIIPRPRVGEATPAGPFSWGRGRISFELSRNQRGPFRQKGGGGRTVTSPLYEIPEKGDFLEEKVKVKPAKAWYSKTRMT